MFAAEFGYTEEHVDWALDMDRIFAHLEYLRENPPAGRMLKLFFESLGGKNSKHSKTSYSGTTKTSRKPTFKTDEERLKWEEQQLAALIQIFGGSGGIIKRGKKGGG